MAELAGFCLKHWNDSGRGLVAHPDLKLSPVPKRAAVEAERAAVEHVAVLAPVPHLDEVRLLFYHKVIPCLRDYDVVPVYGGEVPAPEKLEHRLFRLVVGEPGHGCYYRVKRSPVIYKMLQALDFKVRGISHAHHLGLHEVCGDVRLRLG